METTAPDIELDDMEFTDHDMKMIDETIYMRNMSTSKKAYVEFSQYKKLMISFKLMILLPVHQREGQEKQQQCTTSPYISDFGSSVKSKAIIRGIRSSTSALSDDISTIDVNDIVDFEE
ncbi:Uncharacterized protein Fot_34645 [Forsythia ovata]|uniref:Uncharacterized protein n=1 Tax=Forsythia ovata TaxID=205694 RepID=A0ABD1SMC3_9LAMI